MQPKIVFTDVDGTFADKGHQPLPSDVPTVARLMQAGVPLCLVSARSPEGLYPFQRTLGFTGPLVCYSGAYVLDEQGRELASKVIPAQDATDIYAYLHRELPELCVNTYGFHDWICDDRSDPRVRREEGLVHAQARETDDLMGVFGGRGVHKFLLMGEPAQIAAAEQTVAPATRSSMWCVRARSCARSWTVPPRNPPVSTASAATTASLPRMQSHSATATTTWTCSARSAGAMRWRTAWMP